MTIPWLGDDVASGDEDMVIVIDVLGNDEDVDGDMPEVFSAGDGANGTTSVNPDGTISYTPDLNFTALTHLNIPSATAMAALTPPP